jgi:hypothetical protein
VLRWPDSDLEPREVLWLIEHMPPDSAWAASAQGGPQFRGWRIDTYLLAAVVDVLQAANYQRGGGKGARPDPVKRPGKKQRGGNTLASMSPRQRQGGAHG